jgi:UDP-N-acetylglucosamine--N-acetylmuramyl-(pentapeptide) pyrophosphoryl-undecaprenol N-acetylglucosamine transferase
VGHKHETTISAAYTKVLEPSARKRVIVRDYVNDLHRYTGAADVVVARGGATNLAELALQQKPSIIIPNPWLTGGHQVKNAVAFADKEANVLVSEADLRKSPDNLKNVLNELLHNEKRQQVLAEHIGTFARSDATLSLARLLIQTGKDPEA